MNRRTLIKSTGMAALAAVSPSGPSFANAAARQENNTGFFRFQLGELQVLSVTDGHAPFKPAQPIFAPGINPNELKKILKENFLPQDAVDIAFNVLVVKKGADIIVFD